jgi:hypothetical protein
LPVPATCHPASDSSAAARPASPEVVVPFSTVIGASRSTGATVSVGLAVVVVGEDVVGESVTAGCVSAPTGPLPVAADCGGPLPSSAFTPMTTSATTTTTKSAGSKAIAGCGRARWAPRRVTGPEYRSNSSGG